MKLAGVFIPFDIIGEIIAKLPNNQNFISCCRLLRDRFSDKITGPILLSSPKWLREQQIRGCKYSKHYAGDSYKIIEYLCEQLDQPVIMQWYFENFPRIMNNRRINYFYGRTPLGKLSQPVLRDLLWIYCHYGNEKLQHRIQASITNKINARGCGNEFEITGDIDSLRKTLPFESQRLRFWTHKPKIFDLIVTRRKSNDDEIRNAIRYALSEQKTEEAVNLLHYIEEREYSEDDDVIDNMITMLFALRNGTVDELPFDIEHFDSRRYPDFYYYIKYNSCII